MAEDQVPEEVADDDDHRRTLGDQYAELELGGALPFGPDGTPLQVGEAPEVPAATPENFICLRGPCAFYWELRSFFASGNPKHTWDEEVGLKDEHGQPVKMPEQITRTCLAQVGTETDLTDECITGCSRWTPMTSRELKKLEKRRSKYLKLHPEHDPRCRRG